MRIAVNGSADYERLSRRITSSLRCSGWLLSTLHPFGSVPRVKRPYGYIPAAPDPRLIHPSLHTASRRVPGPTTWFTVASIHARAAYNMPARPLQAVIEEQWPSRHSVQRGQISSSPATPIDIMSPLSDILGLIVHGVREIETSYDEASTAFPSLDDPWKPSPLQAKTQAAADLVTAAAFQLIAMVRAPHSTLAETSLSVRNSCQLDPRELTFLPLDVPERRSWSSRARQRF